MNRCEKHHKCSHDVRWVTQAWMNEWMDGWMDGWIDGRMNRWIDRQTNGRIDGICVTGLSVLHHSLRTPAPDFTWALIKHTCTSSDPHHHTLLKHTPHLTSVKCPISFRHSWTLAPSSTFCQVHLDNYLLCLPRPRSPSSQCHPPASVLGFSVCPYLRSPGPVRQTNRHICSKPSEVSTHLLFYCFLLIIHCSY